ncbi:MAG TPA: acylneuraminate cytidylyltransferase [Pirellulales bacterium]|nr:acylneuraminate cytidylyltransferase [Pirellulales bacterium]
MDGLVARPEVLAIVQARGGSKGLLRKNVLPLGGHPLLAYSIASALAAESITRLIVSTDDDEIAAVAAQYGAEVPFRRPPELAADDTPDYPLFVHALDWLDREGSYRPEIVVQLRPTTPLRPRGLLDEAVRLLSADLQADCVRGVTTPKQTPYKMWRDAANGYLAPLMATEFAEPYNMPRQKLPTAYWQTGHVDAIRTTTIRQQHSLTGKRVRPVFVDWSYCVDIDTLADFELAQQVIDRKHLQIDMPYVAGDRESNRRHGGPSDKSRGRRWPEQLDLVVFDFDGVMTDNRVLVFDDGGEAVLCDRSDGLGVSMLRKRGFELVVLSTETHPVVEARCRKLGIACRQGLADKQAALVELVGQRQLRLENTIYLGNDANDFGCFASAGFAIAVADAHPSAFERVDFVLSRPGGQGAVRELCEILLKRYPRGEAAGVRPEVLENGNNA